MVAVRFVRKICGPNHVTVYDAQVPHKHGPANVDGLLSQNEIEDAKIQANVLSVEVNVQ